MKREGGREREESKRWSGRETVRSNGEKKEKREDFEK